MTMELAPGITVEAFWDWALAQYDCQECQQLLLQLQNEGELVILEALYACWLAQYGHAWRASDVDKMRESTSSWIDQIVILLRQTRQTWKSDPKQQHPRECLLKLEVQAERHLAELMWAATAQCRASGHSQSSKAAEDEMAARMSANLLVLPPFRHGEYVAESARLVALICEST